MNRDPRLLPSLNLSTPNPEVNPSNPEVELRIWDGFDEDEGEDGDDDYDMMSLVDDIRKAEQAKEEEEGRMLIAAAYSGDFRAIETIKQILRNATGKRVRLPQQLFFPPSSSPSSVPEPPAPTPTDLPVSVVPSDAVVSSPAPSYLRPFLTCPRCACVSYPRHASCPVVPPAPTVPVPPAPAVPPAPTVPPAPAVPALLCLLPPLCLLPSLCSCPHCASCSYRAPAISPTPSCHHDDDDDDDLVSLRPRSDEERDLLDTIRHFNQPTVTPAVGNSVGPSQRQCNDEVLAVSRGMEWLALNPQSTHPREAQSSWDQRPQKSQQGPREHEHGSQVRHEKVQDWEGERSYEDKCRNHEWDDERHHRELENEHHHCEWEDERCRRELEVGCRHHEWEDEQHPREREGERRHREGGDLRRHHEREPVRELGWGSGHKREQSLCSQLDSVHGMGLSGTGFPQGRHFSDDGKGNTHYAWRHNAGSHSYSAGRDGKAGPSKYAEHAEPMGWAATNIAGPSSYSQQAPPGNFLLPCAPGSLPLPVFHRMVHNNCAYAHDVLIASISVRSLSKHDRDPHKPRWLVKHFCLGGLGKPGIASVRDDGLAAGHPEFQGRSWMCTLHRSSVRDARVRNRIEGTSRLSSLPPSLWPGSLGGIIPNYQRHPPIPVNKAKLVARKMDIVNISVSWYSAQLASAPPGSITLWMRRLEMMMLSYIDKLDVGGIASHFQEPIRQTGSGTMVADFRWIARWKQQDVCKEGLQLKTTEAKEETFG
ncbi:hypothetical protein BS47DRAFT_1391726 [Hydnum rufescens UP504]|uniref:Uncharacterized protein n=1 Tax=Hydnum rufescens UP504 TaxID=1448309 RepID=A0A9P6B1B7_9AGAM|nr:hypothetical protein BS47DRAFT_1391726 [Hydnum rufescens UP504]